MSKNHQGERIVLASNNPGKVQEIRQLLAGQGIEVIPQKEFDITEVEETGLTFVENAILKARHASRLSGLPAIADDSGIEVDALHGAPGIYSARYSGGNHLANNAKLLDELKETPEPERGARFQCVMVYLRHANDPTPIICQGTWEGSILTKSQGKKGFGYDPVFLAPEDGCSAAELMPEAKNRLSHRGQALRKLLEALKKA